MNRTLTNENGYFRVTPEDAGSFQLYGEGLGYRSSVEGPFPLGEDQVFPAGFRPDPMPVVLDSLRVVARSRRRSLMLSGSYEREAQGLGHYIGPEKIEEKPEARYISDFLWEVPGFRLMPADNFASSGYVPMMRSAATLRGYCVPDVYLDGIPQPEANRLDEIITPWNFEGIEVYRGASEVPSKFTSAGSACGVILLWTRKGRSTPLRFRQPQTGEHASRKPPVPNVALRRGIP